MLTATIAPVKVTAYPGGQAEAPAALGHRALLAFAGLARPEVFADTLQELGVDLKGFRIFPDHHSYSQEELDRLTEAARDVGAGALITTGKDWASLGERWDGEVPLWVLEVEARLAECRAGPGTPGPESPGLSQRRRLFVPSGLCLRLPLPYPAKMFYNTLVQDFINTLTLYMAPLTPTLSPRSGGRGGG